MGADLNAVGAVVLALAIRQNSTSEATYSRHCSAIMYTRSQLTASSLAMCLANFDSDNTRYVTKHDNVGVTFAGHPEHARNFYKKIAAEIVQHEIGFSFTRKSRIIIIAN